MTLSVRCEDCGAEKSIIFRWHFLFYNQYTFLLSVAVLLSGISTTMAAPTESQWWTNPCSVQPVQLRHGRSPAENQLRIFIKMIDNAVFKDLTAIYPNVPQRQLRKSCPRVNSIIKMMTNAKNFTQATHIFYETMVEMAKFIHRIKQVPIKTNAKFNSVKRKRMYEEVEAYLRSVMCEFNETIHIFEPLEPVAVPIRAIRRSISSKCVPKQMGLAKAQVLDIDLFKKLKKFFRQSRKILRQKKRQSLGVRTNGGKSKQNQIRNKIRRNNGRNKDRKLQNHIRTKP